jgi:diguanylate cyclase (GGDEF)-like protein
MTDTPTHVLLVEDNADAAFFVQRLLSNGADAGHYRITRVDRIARALEQLDRGGVDVVVLDLELPDSPARETIQIISTQRITAPVIVLTAATDETLVLRAMQAGAQDFLTKGRIDLDSLLRAIRFAIERHRVLAQAQSLSITDDLTGLYNRRGMAVFFEQMRQRGARNGEDLWVILLDLDGLKETNDSLGHAAGDQAITSFSSLLRQSVRGSEVAARLGGDEFVILALGNSDDLAQAILARLEAAADTFNQHGQAPFRLSFSAGTSRSESGAKLSMEAVLALADNILYERKRAKRLPPISM